MRSICIDKIIKSNGSDFEKAKSELVARLNRKEDQGDARGNLPRKTGGAKDYPAQRRQGQAGTGQPDTVVKDFYLSDGRTHES